MESSDVTTSNDSPLMRHVNSSTSHFRFSHFFIPQQNQTNSGSLSASFVEDQSVEQSTSFSATDNQHELQNNLNRKRDGQPGISFVPAQRLIQSVFMSVTRFFLLSNKRASQDRLFNSFISLVHFNCSCIFLALSRRKKDRSAKPICCWFLLRSHTYLFPHYFKRKSFLGNAFVKKKRSFLKNHAQIERQLQEWFCCGIEEEITPTGCDYIPFCCSIRGKSLRGFAKHVPQKAHTLRKAKKAQLSRGKIQKNSFHMKSH